ARIQVFDAHDQRLLEPPATVAGIRVAGIGDLLATTLKVVGDRGELRDYFDLKTIEELTAYRVEQGLALYVARYEPRVPESAIAPIVRALGYFGDVADDPGLPASRTDIEPYWRRRQPQIVAALAKHGDG